MVAKSSSNSGIVQVAVTKALAAASAYSAVDVLSEDAGSGTAWTFSAVTATDGAGGYITGAVARSESEAVSPRLTLHLWNVIPTNCNLDDNGASTAPSPSDSGYLGIIKFGAMEEWGDDSVSMLSSGEGKLPLPFLCAAAANDLFGVLVTEDAFTQTATDDMTITLTIES